MRHLTWSHRGWWARRWDLVEEDRLVATLAQRGWGMRADLEHGGRRLRLETTGIIRWRMRVVDETGIALATMKPGWRGQGTPELADGRAFSWDAENWWGTRWILEQRGVGHVARLHMGSFLRLDARLEVEPTGLRDDELVPLLALTWYATIVMLQAASSAG